MNSLTPTCRDILAALQEKASTADDLRERTGRGKATVEKALKELMHRDLVAVEQGPDGVNHWILTSHGQQLLTSAGDTASGESDPQDTGDTGVVQDDAPGAGGESEADQPDRSTAPTVKRCRGCGAEIPEICPACWQKTTLYCGACRQSMPSTKRGQAREPRMLSNGLLMLTPGELIRMVEDVMRANPLPDYLGVIGWTASRIAVFLPGRSTGAIQGALKSLHAKGTVQLINTHPMAYQLTTIPDETGESGEPAGEYGDQPGTSNGDVQQ
jgi:DNA-binding MarR family transcriptional regulator